MICLAYLSTATVRMDPPTLGALVAQAQAKNGAKGVTGMLCHYDGSFLQFLEGEAQDVEEIYRRIAADPRHKDLLEVYRKPIRARVFGQWTMAVVSTDDVDPGQRAFCRSLRALKLSAGAEHLRAISPFLDAFRAWIR